MDHVIEQTIPIFGIIFTFGIPGIIIFWAIYSKHRERMRLIEKGLTPEEVKNYFASPDKISRPNNPFKALKWGILLLFLGAGIFIANILEQKMDFNDGITFGVVLLFLGAGFITYFLMIRGRIDDNSGKGSSNITNN